MKAFQTPNSCHSRKGSAKVNRQPINCPEFSQCANYLQSKVQGLELRVKNLNSHHVSENRSTTASKTATNLSPYTRYGSNKQIDTVSYYESIINKRLENISKIEHSPTEQSKDTYSVHSQMSNPTRLNGASIQRIQAITKKLRQFKMVKDQNQDECSPSLSKIKCFCQEYQSECFDFYRCTDLIALKYFIFLLIHELNNTPESCKMSQSKQYQQQIEYLKKQLENQRIEQVTFQGQIKLQKMVVDTQNLIQEIITQLKSKNNQNILTNQVQLLNNQIKALKDDMSQQNQIKNSFGLANYESNENNTSLINQSSYKTNEDRFMTQISSKSKSPYCRNSKRINIDSDQNMRQLEEQTQINRQLMEKIFELQNQDKNTQEIQNQLEQKNQIILQLQKQLNTQDCYVELNQRIQEINKNLDNVIQQNQQLVKENEAQKTKLDQIKPIESKYYETLQENNRQGIIMNQSLSECTQLKKHLSQYEAECKGYQQQILKLQEKCEVLQAQLQDQNDNKYQVTELQQQQQEQNKIINLITDEALYLGQMILYTNDQVQKQQGDNLPTGIKMLQRDLNNKKTTISQKMKMLQQFAINMKQKTHQSSDIDLLQDLPKQQIQINQNNDWQMMLLIQCNTIEKMIDL